MHVETSYLESAIKRFTEYKALGDKTFMQLDEAQMNWRPNEASNSIATIIQHMHGNMKSRWTNFLTEDGEKEWRKRDEEFEQHAYSKDQLLLLWEEGWRKVLATLTSLQPEDLLETITIRSQPLIVIDAINRQLAHYSYHVGQIIFIGKWLLNNEWVSLTIPKGNSKEYTAQLKQSNKM